MYSPQIRPDLVQRLYDEKKRRGVTMTKLVNKILEKALDEMEKEVFPEVHRLRVLKRRAV